MFKKMFQNVMAMAIIACYLSCYQCDNSFSLNDRYNEVVNNGNINLKKFIDQQLPKQSKFFDMNDFDCKFIRTFFFFGMGLSHLGTKEL